jgi:predicted GH43/DUF377 family glycosyl hydrolase
VTSVATGALTLAKRRSRLRLGTRLLAGMLLIGALTAYVVQYGRAGDRLGHHRRVLATTQAELAAQRTDLSQTYGATTAAELAIDAVGTDISQSVASRTWNDAITANTLLAIASVQAELNETDTARFLVAANANEARQCFDGVARAVSASRVGDDATAASALRRASDVCTRTLAYATGARFPYDFPDPFVLRAGGSYYGYATNSGAGDIQVIRSSDLVTWELVGNALAGLPAWATSGATWAPAVLPRGNTYVVYYTVREATTHRQCISRAVAASATGPFLDDSRGPLMCAPNGAIDPSPFVDANGRAYPLWKSEGHTGTPPMLWSQELSGDGRALTGSPRQLLAPDRGYEHGVIEAPSMVREGNTYFLLYSAATWTSSTYAVGYATCAGPTGPCTKPGDNRVLSSGARLAGPGGAEVFRDRGGGLHVGFHAYSNPNVGYPNNRYFYVAPMRIVNGRVVIDAST